MTRYLFIGGEELEAAFTDVGRILVACAELEHAITYLEWQLKSFSLAAENASLSQADMQALIRRERYLRQKYSSLSKRLSETATAFAATAVQRSLQANPRAVELYGQWPAFRERAKALGEARNKVAHSTLTWSANKVVRSIGRPWNEATEVSAEEEKELIRQLFILTNEIGVYTTELGTLLPFADDDRIITAPTVTIDLNEIRERR
jgi:hypothetical protein